MTQALLETKNLHKHFSGVHAINDVSVSFFPAEVVVVMGENGAGKSTLMKVIGGIHEASQGQVYFEGEEVEIDSAAKASELGIAFIHQELNVSENLSIGRNIFLGREPLKNKFFKIVDEAKINNKATALLKRLKLDFSPETLVSELSLGQMQLVEIAKALSQDSKIIIMDEPTSSLTQYETDILLNISRELKEQGVCVVYISHRMKEVQAIADRVLVLRDGVLRGELTTGEIDHDKIVSLMVGREYQEADAQKHQANNSNEVVLEIKDFVVPDNPLCHVDFKLRQGEILGFAGLVGAGRTELMETIFGLRKKISGEIKLRGQQISLHSPIDAIEAGFGFLPEDRKANALILDDSIKNNVVLAGLERYQKNKFVQRGGVSKLAEEVVETFSVKIDNISQEVGYLSGGNQQKIALAKWVTLKPKVLIVDEPTRGVDVISKAEIYALLRSLADEGMAIIMVSSDLEEVLKISDRVLVMHEGKITGELSADELSEEAVMNLATGKINE